MMNAETLELLADKQYGSQCHKAAILQCLNKGLFYDILQQGKSQQHYALTIPRAVMTKSPY